MNDALIYMGYFATVGLLVFLSIKLGKYVDVIDSKSNISGAFIGGVMLAAVTSLPELFTSISSVWIVHENSLIIGNILGSNLINLAFFGIVLLIFSKGLKQAKFSKYYYVALFVALVMYGLVALGLYLAEWMQLTWFSFVSPVILVLYAVFIKKMPKTEEADEENGDEALTLKQAVIRFVICAVSLIATSVAMTYLTDIVSDNLGLEKTFAGALFLGIATSLPELLSTITLCHRKNYNAAAGNILGSNVFNFTILFVSDIFSFPPSSSEIYLLNSDAQWLLILGVVSTLFTALLLLVLNKFRDKKGGIAGSCALCAVLPIIYVVYLLLSTGIISV